MRYLVTGGAGFIGSHVVDRLLAGGARVVVLDDLSTGATENLRHAALRPGFEFELGCVTDRERVRRLVARVDAVFHLAAVVGVRLVLEDPARAFSVNALGAETVLAAAAEAGARILYTSSSEVYGQSARAPFDESAAIDPVAADRLGGGYARAKALGEDAAQRCAAAGAEAITARLFNTVGPRQRARHGMVLPRFCDAALRHEPIAVYGDGLQTRCFAHVHDVVSALVTLADTDAACGQVINVGSAREIPIRALAELVRELAGSRSSIRHVAFAEAYPTARGDVRRRVPRLDRLEALTGVRARIPLERAVADVLADRRLASQKNGARCKPPGAGRQATTLPRSTTSASEHALT